MKKLTLAVSMFATAIFGGLSMAKPHTFTPRDGSARKVSPAPLDLVPHGPLKTATFALG